MLTVADTLQQAQRRIAGAEARIEAEILLCHALGRSRAWLVAHSGHALDATSTAAFEALVARRVRGEPVAYLTGSRGFYGLDLRTTPDVLIPRPETELLVDLALQRMPADAGCAVADLGTGSGAIALAIATARPRARIVAIDASAAALAIARGNAARLGLRDVAFVRGDWCAPFGDGAFDVIVANPPYIAAGDPHLHTGDLRFEPRSALVSGVDGLDAIRVIVRDARAHLHPGGWVLVEHGWEQGAAARGLLTAGGYRDVFTARDLEQRERVSGGRA
ncbi:MAG TPA: peptide chain release factor N(5)-glutamine methyltransferase [Rhodanobacteraceae bacterium]